MVNLIRNFLRKNSSFPYVQSDTLQGVLDNAWYLIEAGVNDLDSTFHLPTVASLSVEGLPVMRTVVLRNVDVETRELCFHTDRRSAKFSELSKYSKICLHFYDASIRTQIRLEASAQLHTADPLAAAAWEASRPFSRLCYSAEIEPGSKVASPPEAPTPKNANENLGYANFCLVRVAVHRLEWLHLAASQQQRAAFEWIGGNAPLAYWLAP